jgi:hypothetical protein
VQAYEWKQGGATLAPNNQSDGETYNRDASKDIHPTHHHQSSMVKGVPLISPFTTSLETLVGLLIGLQRRCLHGRMVVDESDAKPPVESVTASISTSDRYLYSWYHVHEGPCSSRMLRLNRTLRFTHARIRTMLGRILLLFA